jgi:hypothetical protein
MKHLLKRFKSNTAFFQWRRIELEPVKVSNNFS